MIILKILWSLIALSQHPLKGIADETETGLTGHHTPSREVHGEVAEKCEERHIL